MDETVKRQKIVRFLQDKAMSEAVYRVLISAFTKKRTGDDVQTLAAERIAIDLMNDAWRELGKFHVENEEAGERTQIGL